jgi:hypothetical protein
LKILSDMAADGLSQLSLLAEAKMTAHAVDRQRTEYGSEVLHAAYVGYGEWPVVRPRD